MAIPWAQLVRYAPQIIAVSRELLQKSRRGTGTPSAGARSAEADTNSRDALAARIATLEDNERRQAELVESIAEQHAQLARAVVTLHNRQRWLIGALVVATALAVWALLR